MSTPAGDAFASGVPRPVLRHESDCYSGPPALGPLAADLLAPSLQAGDPCLVVAGATKLPRIRSALGAAAEQVSFLDLSVQGRNPGRVQPALQAFVAARGGRPVRVVAEPFHSEQSAAARDEAELCELALCGNGWGGGDVHLTCVHEHAAELPATFARCHDGSLGAEEADALLATRFAAPLPSTPPGARRVSADLTTLREMRGSVESFSQAAGLDAERIDDFVYAVNEVVTNSICHGEGRATVRLWSDADSVLCEVADRGRIADPLIGRVRPGPGQPSGRGLWLVNQLCDLVQVRSGRGGTVVRMCVDL